MHAACCPHPSACRLERTLQELGMLPEEGQLGDLSDEQRAALEAQVQQTQQEQAIAAAVSRRGGERLAPADGAACVAVCPSLRFPLSCAATCLDSKTCPCTTLP